jgi:hypothetical protein
MTKNEILPSDSLLRPTSDYLLPIVVAVGAISTRAFVFLAPSGRQMTGLVPVTKNENLRSHLSSSSMKQLYSEYKQLNSEPKKI